MSWSTRLPYLCFVLFVFCFTVNIICIVKLSEPANKPPVVIAEPEPTFIKLTAEKSYGNMIISPSTVSVHDGDTFKADIDGWPDIIGKGVPVRINGIDTPELLSIDLKIQNLAQKAKSAVVTIMQNAKKIELKNMHRDKYFRIDAKVMVDNVDVGDILIQKGLAKPYDGGAKSVWTTKDFDDYVSKNK